MSRVAVLMAAYNAEKTIVEAVTSVLKSTFPVDLFIVDDCSRVAVEEALGSLRGRVTVIRVPTNSGPAMVRNVGLRRILEAGYDYVAIADADDICYPDRIAKQAAFLDEHPQVAAVGGRARFVNEIGEPTVFSLIPRIEPQAIRQAMFFNLSLIHTTCMIRTEALRRVGLYSNDYPAAEDYELLRRISSQYDLANIPDTIMDYRISPGGISVQRRQRQLFDRARIQLKYFEPLEWRSWAGLGKTALLFLLPLTLVMKIKSARHGGVRLTRQLLTQRL